MFVDVGVFEMKAQALISLHEWVPSIKCSSECVRLQPTWWVAHQTLGRAQMGLGEVAMAVRSFETALHLNPDNEELRKEDLEWAVGLLRQKQAVEAGGETAQTPRTSEGGGSEKQQLTKLRSF